MSVNSEITSKYTDKLFQSHMIGIAKKHGIKEGADQIDKNSYPKIVKSYEDFTGQRYGGENLHPGKTITFMQFVKSASEHYKP